MNVSAALYQLRPFASICIHLHGVNQPGAFETKVEEPEEPAEAIVQFALLRIPRNNSSDSFEMFVVSFLLSRPGRTTPGNPASRAVRIGRMKAGLT